MREQGKHARPRACLRPFASLLLLLLLEPVSGAQAEKKTLRFHDQAPVLMLGCMCLSQVRDLMHIGTRHMVVQLQHTSRKAFIRIRCNIAMVNAATKNISAFTASSYTLTKQTGLLGIL